MDSDIWDTIGGEDEYDENNNALPGFADDADDDESANENLDLDESVLEREFNDDGGPELQMGWTESQNVSVGGAIITGEMGAMANKISLAMMDKDQIYDIALTQAMEKWFEKAQYDKYIGFIKKRIVRYWFKNADGMAAVCFMISQMYPQSNPLLTGRKEPDRLTADTLEAYTTITGIRKEDLFRYYRLFIVA